MAAIVAKRNGDEMSKFRANVELVDASGESCGLYMREGTGAQTTYTDEHVWHHGGRPVFERERLEWGWTVDHMTPEWLAEWQSENDQSRWPDRGERNDGYLDAMNREIEIAQKASR